MTHDERVERWQRMLLDLRFDGGIQAIIDAFSDEILEVRNEALDEAINAMPSGESMCGEVVRLRIRALKVKL